MANDTHLPVKINLKGVRRVGADEAEAIMRRVRERPLLSWEHRMPIDIHLSARDAARVAAGGSFDASGYRSGLSADGTRLTMSGGAGRPAPSGAASPYESRLSRSLQGNLGSAGAQGGSSEPGSTGREPPADVVRAAQQAERNWGVPASVTLAQWAQESGWGHHMPEGSNNPFGIKASDHEAGIVASTTEWEHGVLVHRTAKFRTFASIGDAFDQHGRLLATGKAYAGARALAGDPDAYARAMTHHYSSDAHYGDELVTIMKGSDLYRFDAKSR